MSTFIRLFDGRYISLDKIDQITRTAEGRYIIEQGSRCLDPNHPDLHDTIVSAIPVQGEWEALSLDGEEEGKYSIEPIFAWGLTIFGQLRPLAPGSMTGELTGCAYRRRGTATVYYELDQFDDADKWMAFLASVRTGRQ